MTDKLDESHLLQISALARSFGVSSNTIRRLETAGLITPAHVTEGSGYRYYDSNNVLLLTELFALKSFGFEYEDLREYLSHPGDYSSLYAKLIEKQQALNYLIDLLGRKRIPLGYMSSSVVELAETYCFCKDVVMVPEYDAVFGFLKDFLFEAVSQGMPIDTLKSIQVITDCLDYRDRDFRQDHEQHLVFSLPLTGMTEHPQVRRFPTFTAVNIFWNTAQTDPAPVVDLLDTLFAQNGLSQSDTLRVVINPGWMMDKSRPKDNRILRLLVPFTKE